MAKWPGLPERLRAAFEQAGYWKNGRPDVLGFSLQHRFLAGYTYKWLGGYAVPDRDNLLRLADALNVSPAWLLFGDETPPPKGKKSRRPMYPIAGGSDADVRHYVNQLLYWWYSLRPSRRWALA
jgi:transcriptional regulator with XRE-family HTH domain